MAKSIDSNLSTEQLAERKKSLGGSDAGAVLGLSPYRTPFDVWLDKTGRAPELDDTDAMFWGRVLEDTVAKVYADRSGDKIRRRGFERSREFPWMHANIDRVIVGDPRGVGVLEIKTAGQYSADDWGESGTNQIPEHYYAQVAHYLAVTGYTWARLAVLIGGRDFRVYDVPRDDEIIDRLIDLERDFWRLVETDMPPEPTNAADMAKRWPKDTGAAVVADDEMMAKVEMLRTITTRIKSYNEQKTELETAIKGFMQSATTLVDAAGTPLATWKTQTTRRLDTKAIRAVLGSDVAQYETEMEARVLRIKK